MLKSRTTMPVVKPPKKEPDPNRPVMNSAKYEFSQEGNTSGTTEDYEQITIELEAPLGDLSDGFFTVIKSTTGWSIDTVQDLQDLIDRCDPTKR